MNELRHNYAIYGTKARGDEEIVGYFDVSEEDDLKEREEEARKAIRELSKTKRSQYKTFTVSKVLGRISLEEQQ